MKRWIARAALGVLAVALAGCGPKQDAASPAAALGNAASGTDKPKPVVGVSLLTTTNPFFEEMGAAMVAEGKKRGYDVQITSGEMDPARQRDQVKDFLVRKVSAIILCPCDSKAVGASILEANKAGVPVFTADIASLDKSAKVVSHIATDNYAGGKMAARAMIEALGGQGKVAIIDHPEVESVIQRTQGFREVMKGAKGIQIVAQLPGGGQRDVSFKTAQDILERNPDLKGIFAINDPSALGAVAAIEKAGRAGQIKVVGFDGQREAKQAIKDGKIYADAVQYPDRIGTLAIQAVSGYLSGDKVPPQTLIPTGLYRQADAQKDPALK